MKVNIFFLGILLSCVIHFFVQKIFIYYGRFDDINHRSTHNTLATRTGGIGLFTTLFLFSIYFYFLEIEIFDYSLFIPLGIMFIVGVYDDFYNADFKLKFLLQIIVAKILIDQGYYIDNYYGLFGLNEIPWILAQATTIFVFLIIINAINFIDGIDGLAISEVIKTLILIEFCSNEFTPFATLAVILIASLLPLYYFNFKQNHKVFLGDAGSLFLGTIVSIYIFYVLGENYDFKSSLNINKIVFSILILIYPLLDLLRVFVLRTISGNSPFKPDQNHLHHLISRKFSKPMTVVLICSTSLFVFFFFISKN